MRPITLIALAALGLVAVAACQSSGVISEVAPDEARTSFEEQKARQIYDEYWQAQMEREAAIADARERARARQEMMRRETNP